MAAELKTRNVKNYWPHVTRHLVTIRIKVNNFVLNHEGSVMTSYTKRKVKYGGLVHNYGANTRNILRQENSSRTRLCCKAITSWTSRVASQPPKPGNSCFTIDDNLQEERLLLASQAHKNSQPLNWGWSLNWKLVSSKMLTPRNLGSRHWKEHEVHLRLEPRGQRH